jgi:phosphatidylethanolamine/phosphatidyl-N-methylethanolamine N-methyltransferase
MRHDEMAPIRSSAGRPSTMPVSQPPSPLRVFVRQFRRNFHTTGSIVPSSRFLAGELARLARERSGDAGRPWRILEVGPGTGVVTGKIIAAMNADDRLDLVELNDAFVALLRERLQTDRPFAAVAGRVRIFHQPVEQMVATGAYDLVVSGLPLNNFAVDQVRHILDVFRALLKPGGCLSYFEYFAIRKLRALVSGRAERARLRGIGELTGQMLAEHEVRRRLVWLNFPPAWVHHVRWGVPETRPGSRS